MGFVLAGFLPLVGCVGGGDPSDEQGVGIAVEALSSDVFYGSVFFQGWTGGNYGVGVDLATSQPDGSNSLNFDLSLVPGLYSYNVYGYQIEGSFPPHFRSGALCEVARTWGQAEVRRGNRPTQLKPSAATVVPCGPALTDTFVVGSDYEPGEPVPDHAIAAVRIRNPIGEQINFRTLNGVGLCLSMSKPTVGPQPNEGCTIELNSTATNIDFYAYARPHAHNRPSVDYWSNSIPFGSVTIIASAADATEVVSW